VRIIDENELIKKYGLKNKREIWKADASIGRIRNMAKQLITRSDEEKKAFVEKLQKKGFHVQSIAESLALNKEDWLKRRLQTVVHAKKLSNTPKQARQLVVHKHVSIGKRIVNKPSYQVSLEQEPEIKLNLSLKKEPEKKSKIEDIKKEIENKKTEKNSDKEKK
jgi:small subunit ribosomal protein S4